MNKKWRSVLIGFLIFTGLTLGIALILPASYTIKESVIVHNSRNATFALVGDLPEWTKWSKWHLSDPEARLEYSTPSFGLKSTMEWKGEKIGSGKLRVVQFNKQGDLGYTLDFFRPFPMSSHGNIHVENLGDSCKVTWIHTMEAAWPIGRYMMLFMDAKSRMQADFAEGLQNLKRLAEALPKDTVPDLDIRVTQIPTRFIYARKVEVESGKAWINIKTIIGEIGKELDKENITYNDSNLVAVIYRKGTNRWIIQPGIIFDSPMSNSKDGTYGTRPLIGDNVIQVLVEGPYSKVDSYYLAIQNWMKKNGYISYSEPWETYLTDGSIAPDSSAFKTLITYPVAPSSYDDTVAEETKP